MPGLVSAFDPFVPEEPHEIMVAGDLHVGTVVPTLVSLPLDRHE
jgi:hypothetical protein